MSTPGTHAPGGRPRPPAMSDVAREAGVSHQTVSRVLNAHPSVRDETRDRVLAAIAHLGYRRNTAARALVTRRSGTIGVVTSGSALFGPTSTLIAVEGAARDAGLYVSVATLARWEAVGVRGVLEHFLSQGVDGIVVIAGHDEAVEAVRASGTGVPVVMVGPPDGSGGRGGTGGTGGTGGDAAGAGLHAVAVDQYAGARMATRHLLDLGHRHVTHLAGPPDWLDARSRVAGWRDELVAAGIEPGEPLAGTWHASRGYEVGLDLVARGLPTAVFAANDQLALGLLRAFAESGVAVPGDVSVVGFDDVDGSANFYPPLTTVRQEFGELGRRCLQTLLEVMAGGTPDPAPIAPRLVVRATTGSPRGGAHDARPGGAPVP